MNNLEGFINDNYLRLYDPEYWERINEEYRAKDYIPNYKIIGSIDFDSLCLGQNKAIYIIPFIPMSEDSPERYADSLETLKRVTETNMQVMDESYENYGLELHFLNPLVFGGSPTNSENRTYISQSEHVKACNFWNKTYFRMMEERKI